jgi:hypothetical protein
MARKQSNAFRSAGKGTGVKVNVETGVEIVTLTFLGKRTGSYEVRGPALNDAGYIVIGTVGSKADADALALAAVEALRTVQDNDHAKARDMLAAEIKALIEDTRAVAETHDLKPVRTLFGGAIASLVSGFLDAAYDRITRARAIIADPSLVPSEADAAEALRVALALIGKRVHSTRHGEDAVVNTAYIAAEDNRVILSCKFRKGWASVYASDVKAI